MVFRHFLYSFCINDQRKLKNSYLENTTIHYEMVAGDISGDNRLTVLDAILIQRLILETA